MATPIRMMLADNEYMDKVFVELSSENETWGIVSQEQLLLTLTVYSSVSGKPWVFDLDELIDALQRARECLMVPPEGPSEDR